MRLRFILAMALVAVIAVFSVVLYFRLDAGKQLETYLTRGGMVGMSDLVDSLEEYYQVNAGWEGVEQVISSAHTGGMPMGGFRRGQGGPQGMAAAMMQVELVSPDGEILYDSAGLSTGTQLNPDLLNQSIQLRDDRRKVIGYLLIAGGGALQQGNFDLLLSILNSAALFAGLVAIGIGLVVALLLASGLIRPVRNLTQAAQAMAEGDLSQRVTVQGSDELAVLGNSFNHMAASLEESERQRRALTADVAHELRTPLAVQRAQVEAMLDGVYSLDDGNLIKVLEQNELLSRLVEDLRTLALVDAGELPLDRTSMDLVEKVSQIVERFKPAAGSRELEMQAQQKELCVQGDPIRIEQILNNLLSNAIRYTPEVGKITIRVSQGERDALVEVRDSGTGIPADAAGKIFGRFYRADASRSRQDGGSGLGLAIARQLALAHGGDLSAANHPQGGAVFTLRLPLEKLGN